jgi:hypothetical protein
MSKLILLLVTTVFAITVSVNDFKPAFGKWQGTITYLDYSTGKSFTMPANLTITKKDAEQLVFAFEYPKEPKANGKDTLTISDDGTMIDDAIVVSKQKENGTMIITAEKNGVDGNDNKKAVMRYVYTIGKKIFCKRKEVKFDGEEKWIMRNEYKMSR